jgi:hypothetical protein
MCSADCRVVARLARARVDRGGAGRASEEAGQRRSEEGGRDPSTVHSTHSIGFSSFRLDSMHLGVGRSEQRSDVHVPSSDQRLQRRDRSHGAEQCGLRLDCGMPSSGARVHVHARVSALASGLRQQQKRQERAACGRPITPSLRITLQGAMLLAATCVWRVQPHALRATHSRPRRSWGSAGRSSQSG